MLTANDVKTLSKPFARDDHEFLGEFVYITEEAITQRLDEVDPSWSFELLNISISGNNAVVHARLTILGTSRENIGMQKIIQNAGEPEKGAATDALKRCARLFGVGRYLLGAPAKSQFQTWLDKLSGGTGNPTPPTYPTTDLRNPQTANEFVKHWHEKTLTNDDLKAALGVTTLAAWTGGRTKADAQVETWLRAQQNKKAAS
jgi:hypothetical protein